MGAFLISVLRRFSKQLTQKTLVLVTKCQGRPLVRVVLHKYRKETPVFSSVCNIDSFPMSSNMIPLRLSHLESMTLPIESATPPVCLLIVYFKTKCKKLSWPL